MRIKAIVDEDFVNYKQASMFVGTAFCGGKCCIEAGIPLNVCQNDEWRKMPVVTVDDRQIIERYLSNPLTSAIVFGGLEPFEQAKELSDFVDLLRGEYKCSDPVVIYTGYYPEEIEMELADLMVWDNVIVKFGRFIPDRKKRFDPILGVWLASDNQYAGVLDFGDIRCES